MNRFQIEIYNIRERVISTLDVEELAGDKFRMIDNAIFPCTLTKGTEFETRINKNGQHEVVRITKPSEFITRRFMLLKTSDTTGYLMLGEELTKRGGFWQVDFGGILTVNIPKDFEFNVDDVIREFNLKVSEITE